MFPQVDACAKGLFVGMVSQSDKYSAHFGACPNFGRARVVFQCLG